MDAIERLLEMFGLASYKGTSKHGSKVSPDISRAVQRNEQASQRAQQALEELRMSDTVRHIAGKMK